MKLLKTVLLSTSLLMSVPFAAHVTVTDDAASPARADEVLQTVQAFNQYKAKNEEIVLRLLTRDAGLSKEALGLTAESTYIDIMKKLSSVLKGLTAELRSAKEKQATTDNELTEGRDAHAKLTREKAALEAELKEANDKLEAVTKAKDDADRQLVIVGADVEQLTAALEATNAEATQAIKDSQAKIEKLTADLTAASKERDTLKEKGAELEVLKASAEESQRQKEAGLRALKAQIGAAERAVKEGHSAAATSDFDPLDNFDLLLTGAEDEGFAASSPRSLGDISPLGALDSTPPRGLVSEFTATPGPVVHTGAGHTVAPAAVDAKTAAKITSLKAELAKAQVVVAAGTTWSGEVPSPEAKVKTKNAYKPHQLVHEAYVAAQTEVARLTAELVKLGVAPAATTSK